MLNDVIKIVINPIFNICYRFKIFYLLQINYLFVTLFSSNDRIINFKIKS